MLRLSPAGYEPHPELCVVATYFNALGYQTPRANFLRFLEPLLKGKTQLVVVEGLHDGVVGLPSALRERVRWVGVPCEGGLWQKERLVNVAIEHVPAACTVIAWLDGDILFSDPRWMPKTVEAIHDGRRFVQPFDDFIRLPRHPDPGPGMFTWVGYGYQVAQDPSAAGADWFSHGHTGLAWAGRADLLRATGLYDRWLAGTGDHLMAHAMTSTTDCPCIAESLGADSPSHRDFLTWASGWACSDQRAVGCLDGAIFHLWHGEYGNRLYREREAELRELDFDPRADLDLTAAGALRLRSDRADLDAWANVYVSARREDG